MRTLVPVLLTTVLAAVPLAAQPVRTATPEESARIGSLENVALWLGVLVGEQGRRVVVGMPVRPVEGADLRSGDVIERVNGTEVRTVDEVNRAFDAIPVGETVRISVRRDEAPVTVRFAKPANVPRAAVQLRRRDGAPR